VRGESAMHGGWWPAHAHVHKRFFFSYLFLSPKYILLINHFSLHLIMQNSYSVNRCCGVSYSTLCAVACACTRANPGTNVIYNIFPSAFRCVPFHVISSFFAPLRYLVPLYALILPSLYHHFTLAIIKS